MLKDFLANREAFLTECNNSNTILFILRVPACKNQTNSSFRGKGRKFDFTHIPMVDRLGHDKNYWIVFFDKISFYFKEICKLPNSVEIVI